MRGSSLRLVDELHPVQVFAPAVPNSAAPAYVNLADGYNHVTFVITGVNTTGVTGTAVTLTQATDVTGATNKAISFLNVWSNTDTVAGDTLTLNSAVVSNTFTIETTNNKQFMYILEVDAALDLDQANGYTAVTIGLANAVNQTIEVTAYLSGARIGGGISHFPSAIT